MTDASSEALPASGLLVYRASRLEALLEPLAILLQGFPPAGLLAPAELICAHPGMRRWLLNQLAQRSGPRGIAANLRIDLPGQWVERVSRQHGSGLQQPAPTGALLHWRLFDSFAQAETLSLCPAFARYLADDPAGRRRWQLAHTLADIYGRLLVYRPEWLLTWQDGHVANEAHADLATLWRLLRQRWPEPLRIDQQEAIRRGLQSTEVEFTPLHVFGLSHLPPATLALLRAAARQRPIVLYFPDPCREHWVGLRDDRQRLRQLLEAGADQQAELLYLGTEHPLLASLGRLGQHFSAMLAGADDDILLDVRHWQDEQDQTSGGTLLERLQQSVRELDAERIAAAQPFAIETLAADASLRVHRCHSRLRELEVLRDALLQALNDFDDLQPSDIAVLSPSMQAYAPLLPAVFGAPADPGSRLPYHVADLPQSADHPLFGTFLAFLNTPVSRLSCSEVLSLLDLDLLRRGLGMEDLSRQQIEHWLRSAAIAWGLDQDSRRRNALPGEPAHSFAWGFDRLIAGHLFGDDAEAAGLIDGVSAVPALALGDSAGFGGLYRLLSELHRLRALADTAQPASRWATYFQQLANTLFEAPHQDQDGRRALAQLKACLGRLEQQRSASQLDPDLSHAQALAWVRDALAEVPESSPFLHGGISFCGMVPQRALPFRLIAVLGLNETDYPRRETAEQHDPMRLSPRPGDRNVLIDDRYLFLETLMSARQRLHLSFVGEHSASGKPLNPSAPLFELDRLLQQQISLRDADRKPLRPWWIEHPLQPFDSRYFAEAAHPALFTYHQGFALKPQQTQASTEQSQAPATEQAIPAPHLLRWLRDPAAQLLRDRHKLRLDGVDVDQLPEHEPLDREFGGRDPLWRHLLMTAIDRAQAPPEQPDPLLLASGRLPAGELGLRLYRLDQSLASALWQHSLSHTPLRSTGLSWSRLSLQAEHTGGIEGALDRVLLEADRAWLIDWQPKHKKAERWSIRLPLLTRWLLLSLHTELQQRQLHTALITDQGLHEFAIDLNQIAAAPEFRTERGRQQRRQALELIVTLYRQAEREPLAYFPALAAELSKPGKPDVEAVWFGGRFKTGEREYQPGYARLLSGDQRFWLDHHPASGRLLATCHRLSDLLNLSFDRQTESATP